MSEETESSGTSAGTIVVWIGGLGIIGLGVVLYFALLSPAMEKQAKAEGRVERKSKQLAKQSTDHRKAVYVRDELRTRVTALAEKIKTEARAAAAANPEMATMRSQLKKTMPPWSRHRETIGSVKEDAEETNVTLKTYTKRKQESHGAVMRLSLDMTVIGTYAQLTHFLGRLTTRPRRLLILENFRVQRQGGNSSPFQSIGEAGQNLLLKMRLVLFFRKAESEGAPLQIVNPPITNPPWQVIRGSFWAHAANALAAAKSPDSKIKRDPFTSMMSEFHAAPAPADADADPSATPSPLPGENAKVPPAPPGDAVLIKYPVERYQLLAVTLIPEPGYALVLAPNNKGYKVTIDTKLGNAQGMVFELRKDAIVIDEPLSDTPKVLKVPQ